MTRRSLLKSVLIAPFAGLVGKKAVAGYEIHPEKYYDAWVWTSQQEQRLDELLAQSQSFKDYVQRLK